MTKALRKEGVDHPYVGELKRQLADKEIGRRDFLQTATMLGMSATAAYAFAGKVTGEKMVSRAKAADMPMGGTPTISARVQDFTNPHADSWGNVATRTNYDYLAKTHVDNITRPMMLESWSASDDLRTWEFKLRPGINFHNGRQFTSDDAIWNIEHMLDDSTGSSVLGLMKDYMLNEVTTTVDGEEVTRHEIWDANAFEKVDDLTFRMNTKAPNVGIPEHLWHYPAVMMDPEEGGVMKAGSNGTGPFPVVDFELGRRIRVEANADYWARGMDFGGGKIGPYFDAVEFVDLGDDTSAFVAAMASRQVMGGVLTDNAQIAIVETLPHVDLYQKTTSITVIARGHTTTAPFDDPRVRKALRLATDQQGVLALGVQGYGSVAEHHHVSPVHPDYYKLPFFGQNIEEAKRLLAEAGHPNLEMVIETRANPAWEINSAQALQEQWKAVGVNATVNVNPSSQYWPNWTKFPFSLTGWSHRPLAVMLLALAYKSGVPWNESNFSNAEFDEILAQAEGILDAKERSLLVKRLEEIMQEDGPLVQSFWRDSFGAMDKRVLGYAQHPQAYFSLEEYAIAG
ncbi:MAG: ABC transporter substrate-binding protein [Alphaproteobacteria bacterium]